MRVLALTTLGLLLAAILSAHPWIHQEAPGRASASALQKTTIQRINPPGSTQPTKYKHLVKAGNTLYLSGQTSSNGKGELIGKGDMRAQVRQVYENIKRILAHQGASFDNLVKITIYTVDVDEFLKTTDIREQYTGGRAPASTLVQIDRLANPDYLVEIEGTAVF
jgi:enamine deaminase RidA (YjgF/YER057c/UK114 family)